MTEQTQDKQARYALEEHLPLSGSLIWKLQRAFYEKNGPEAWTQGIVPFQATTNPYIANVYARVALAFMRDWLGDEFKPASNYCALDLNQPIYIIELGSGPGRLGFNFLRQLTDSLSQLYDGKLRPIIMRMRIKIKRFFMKQKRFLFV